MINIQNKKDLITIDFRLKQIRYLEDKEKNKTELYNIEVYLNPKLKKTEIKI